jgi:DNA-binding transcriptional MerR regulator
MFRKLGITAPQCAIGFRLANVLKDLGVDEENFGNFVSQVYNQCTHTGLKPEYFANNIKQILDLSGSIPLSEIPHYIQEKTNERRKLEEDIRKLRMDESDARVTLIEALDEKKVSLAELDQFYPLKVELDKLGIPVEDLRRTTEIIQGAQKSGYSVKTITHLLSTWETSSAIQARIEKNILNHNVSVSGFLAFVALFIPVFWSWIGVTFYNTRFETDDVGHRLLTLLQMAATAFMAVCVSDGFGKYSSGFALSYAATRAILVIEYLRTGRNIPATRPLVKRYSIGFSIAAGLYLL